MPTREVTLDENASAVANAAGVATVRLAPSRLGQVWQVVNEAVSVASPVTGSTATPSARLYSGAPTAGQLLAGTYDGNNDSASVAVTLTVGSYLTCVWNGCDPGSVCTLSIYGTMRIPA